VTIRTIDDLRQASDEEIEAAKAEITVVDDLYTYLAWLNSSKGEQSTVKFKVGHRDRSLGIHPSTVAKEGVCKLRVLWEVTGEVPSRRKFDPKMQLIWDLGTAMHSMMQKHFSDMYGVQFVEEVFGGDKELLISSHADAVFDFARVRFIFEMKTIKEGGNFGFAKVQHAPFKDNVRQTMTYMKLHDCPFGLIFYFAKNNSEIKEHVVVWDDELWDEIQNETILPVIEAANGGPMIEPTTGWHCRNQCQFYHGCEAGRNHGKRPGRLERRLRQLPGK
jgi:hypothetical protein